METGLEGIRVAVLGGDERELVLIPALARAGAEVVVTGYPPRPELAGIKLVDTVAGAVEGAQVVILPMPGTDDQGVVRAVFASEKVQITWEVFSRLAPGTLVIIGTAKPFLRQWAGKFGFRLVEIAEEDEVAVLNAVPTAEGALEMAMHMLPITIHGCEAFVLGFGRVGQVLAERLAGLHARTTVVARSRAALAKAWAAGYSTCAFGSLPAEIGRAQIVFNTVPAPVLTEMVLAATLPEVLIIDLASAPGGTDFQAAQKLERKAVLAPGLPGKVAPLTAGKVLAAVIPRIIRQNSG
ncbi:MAG: dipicolinate synthase subunit DpsA [Clostridia bacterium]|nr:MAG: dipicolinate synthase subunit DpsA [Clostridia bacterium]